MNNKSKSLLLLPDITNLSCRFCLTRCSEGDFSVSVEISNQYEEFTGFKVNDIDIPKKICAPCKSLLHSLIRFKRKAAEVETYLVQISIKQEQDLIDFGNHTKSQEFTDLNEPELQIDEIDEKLDYFSNSDYESDSNEKPKQIKTEKVPVTRTRKKGRPLLPKDKRTDKIRLVPYDNLENPLQCSKCHKVFRSFADRRLHFNWVHKDHKISYCDICNDNKPFNEKHYISKHMRSRHLEKEPCPDCGKYFGPGRLIFHQRRTHSTDKKIVCQLCGQAFALNEKFKEHMLKEHTKEDDWKHECKYCKKKVNFE